MFGRKRDYSSVELFVGKGTVFRGNVYVEGSAVVMGKIEGNIDIKGDLVVENGGAVEAEEVNAGSIVSSGRIITNTLSANRAEFKKTAEFSGNIRCKLIIVEEGAKIEGNISQILDVQTQNKDQVR